MFLQIIGVIAVASSVIPWILIPVIPLLIAFLFLRRYFLQTSRDVKRIESTSKCLLSNLRIILSSVMFLQSSPVSLVWCCWLCIYVSTARSPVFSHLSSSLQGLCTIRAFKAEERFQQAFDAHQDLHSGPWRNRLLAGLRLAVDFINVLFQMFGVLLQRPGSCSWPLHAGLQCVWMECVRCLWPSQPLDAFFLKTVRYPKHAHY